jgi:energy-coupling factor transporter ATP-binding protein EcfA2
VSERQRPSASLTIAGLTKSFGGVQVLKGIDLAVAPGEFISLVGPSGCGKTTTLNTIAGFETPDGGDVQIDGMSIVKLPSYRRGLGMVSRPHHGATLGIVTGGREGAMGPGRPGVVVPSRHHHSVTLGIVTGDRLHLPEDHGLGLVLSLDRARRLLPVHRRLEALRHDAH